MSPPAELEELAALKEYWRQWTGIIERIAQRRGRAAPSDATAYAELYEALMAACCDQAAATQGADQAFFERLAGFVRPWLTVDALARTDRKTLGDFLRQCQEITRTLGVVEPVAPPWRPLGVGAALVLGLAAAGSVGLWLAWTTPEWLEETWRAIQVVLPIWTWLVLAAAGTLVFGYWATRVART